MNKAGAGILTVLLTAMLWAGSAAAQTVCWWTGEGIGTTWEEPNNWSILAVPGTNHAVYLGYSGDSGDVPDIPQSITLTDTQAVNELVIMAEGNRQVTLSGSNLFCWFSGDAITIDAGAESDTTFNCNLGLIRNATLRNNSMQDVIITGSTFRPTHDPSGGGYKLNYYGADGNTLRLQGTDISLPHDHYTGGDVQCETDGQTLGRWNPQAASCRLLLAASPDLYVMSTATATALVQRVGAPDRTVMADDLSGSSGAEKFYLVPAEPGEGHLTLRFGRLVSSAYIETTADSTAEAYPHQVPDRSYMEGADTPGVIGPGNFKVNMPGATFICRREMAYTGGTLVSTGTLQLASEGVGTNGALPDTGLVEIESTGIFDLNGIDDTIGTLGGVGEVRLGDATLTMAEGVAPGMSVGTQTVSEAGTVILGGTSTFEIDATNAYDQVLIQTADLELNGTLNVVVNGPFKDEYFTTYKIFDLTDGTASSMFTALQDNFNGHVTCEIVGNKDVIITLHRPTGTAITVQ